MTASAQAFPSRREASPLVLLCSFEGPDPYSQAGGLGVRMADLSRACAEAGWETHLYFIGDPKKPGREKLLAGRLTYHRWCQWISRYHPYGVYDGEEGKLSDYAASLPPALLEERILPAVEQSRPVVVLAEEWHTVPMLFALADRLRQVGLRDQVVLLWNANNVFGFDRIPWRRLAGIATITTVSRYMKHLMWPMGVNPLVIPNGIPSHWLEPLPRKLLTAFSTLTRGRLTLAKVGRFDPDKRWLMAVEAVAALKSRGMAPLFLLRGGMEPHGHEVRDRARMLGLRLSTVRFPSDPTLEECLAALKPVATEGVDLVEIGSFVPVEFLRLLYRGADAVLAASGKEPFGLVGLEVMGSGGVAVTGSTGEDYAVPFRNALVADTEIPEELVRHLVYLAERPLLAKALRREGERTARSFQWEHVLEILMEKARFAAFLQGVRWGSTEGG